jgi:hypothetical protein
MHRSIPTETERGASGAEPAGGPTLPDARIGRGRKLPLSAHAEILRLAAAGRRQVDIAREVGCHQATVSRTLADYDDSRALARKFLEAKALDMTKRLVADAKAETILRVLAKLDVVRDEDLRSSTPGVVIQIGTPGAPLQLPAISSIAGLGHHRET